MTIARLSIILTSFFFFAGTIICQEKIKVPTETTITYAVKRGEIPSVKDKITSAYVSTQWKPISKREKQVPKNFVGRLPSRVIKSTQNQEADKLTQKKNSPLRSTIDFNINIDGLDTGGSPGDASGDIGRDHYVQAVNTTTVGVYDKQGQLIVAFDPQEIFWSEINQRSAGDPIVMYDQEADRWLITEIAPANRRTMLIAVSQTSDPLGAYYIYEYGTPEFPDYPKYSIWSNAYTVTTNEVNFTVLHAYVIERAAMLAGEDNVQIQRVSLPGSPTTESSFLVATPVDWTGKLAPPEDRDPMFLALNDSTWNTNQTDDQLEIFSIDIDWINSDNTTFFQQSLITSPYDAFPCSVSSNNFSCVAQNSSTGLDALPEVIMNQVHYRNFGTHEAIVLNFITDATGNNRSGIRWMELRKNSNTEWRIYQEGTWAIADGLDRFMGASAIDGNGNIALAYSTSSSSTFADLRVTGRLAGDPLGTMTFDETIIAPGVNGIPSNGRFGDYAHMVVDPVDESTFWFTSEYATNGTSTSRITAFKLQEAETDLTPTALVNPITGPNLGSNENITIQVKNVGQSTVDNFRVGYQFDGGNINYEDATRAISSGDIYNHTFNNRENFSTPGDYNITLHVDTTDDLLIANDSKNTVVTHVAMTDVSILSVVGLDGLICGSDDVTALFRIYNNGLSTVTEVEIGINVNGSLSSILTATNIEQYESKILSLSIPNAVLGSSPTITFSIISVNGVPDENISNDNNITLQPTILPDGVNLNLELLTDNFPSETTWELTNTGGQIINESGSLADSGTQTTVITPLCLDPNACYIFTIFDSAADGITFNGVQGGYEIIDDNGIIFAGLIQPNFGVSESNTFCATYACNLSVEIGVLENGPDDYDLVIVVENGVGPDFEYSIDGVNFQSQPVFENLVSDQYTVIIRDSSGCEVTEVVMVGEIISVVDINQVESDLTVYPNPTDGVIHLNVKNLLHNDILLPITIIDNKGLVVQHTAISKYDNIYKGTISLYDYPSGVYYIQLLSNVKTKLVMVIRN